MHSTKISYHSSYYALIELSKVFCLMSTTSRKGFVEIKGNLDIQQGDLIL